MTLLSLTDAKAALNITSDAYNDELQDYIDGAVAAVEFICGPAESEEVSEVVQATAAIGLTRTPVLAVTSVTGDLFGARVLSDLHIDLYAGVIRTREGVTPLVRDTYTVVYTTGRAAIPPAMKQAAKVILKHQWSTQRGPAAKATTADGSYVPGFGFAVPNAALQMLAPYDRGPAVG